MQPRTWHHLRVTERTGEPVGMLGDLVYCGDKRLLTIVLNDEGGLYDWPEYYLSLDDEEAGENTPQEEVDWSGFSVAAQRAMDDHLSVARMYECHVQRGRNHFVQRPLMATSVSKAVETLFKRLADDNPDVEFRRIAAPEVPKWSLPDYIGVASAFGHEGYEEIFFQQINGEEGGG